MSEIFAPSPSAPHMLLLSEKLPKTRLACLNPRLIRSQSVTHSVNEEMKIHVVVLASAFTSHRLICLN